MIFLLSSENFFKEISIIRGEISIEKVDLVNDNVMKEDNGIEAVLSLRASVRYLKYILTSIWMLRTPNAGQNMLF